MDPYSFLKTIWRIFSASNNIKKIGDHKEYGQKLKKSKIFYTIYDINNGIRQEFKDTINPQYIPPTQKQLLIKHKAHLIYHNYLPSLIINNFFCKLLFLYFFTFYKFFPILYILIATQNLIHKNYIIAFNFIWLLSILDYIFFRLLIFRTQHKILNYLFLIIWFKEGSSNDNRSN